MPKARASGCSPSTPEAMRQLRSPRVMVTVVLLAAVLLWDASGLDLAVMHLWGSADGFALKTHPWLAGILHSRAQQVATWVLVLLWVLVWLPVGAWRQIGRRERLAVALAVTLSVQTVSVLKHFSLTSCPWELQVFGGSAVHVSHWTWGVGDGGGGKCFPGGHASSAFGFLAASLPFLFSGQDRLVRLGRRLLAAVVLVGLVFGLTQTVRGAHHPSHTLWSAWICWTVGLLVYHLLAGRAQPHSR